MPDANGWIRVEDALPKTPKWRWVWTPNQRYPGPTNVTTATFTQGDWRDWAGHILYVTHHQPQQYPAPPEDD
ncbi:hypothetical protein LCGC14_1808160 [marine sediment metagenome]|uniref:Uncharacterized protein n=1 Tax=marine sediment metagenome TaxID=412755 RepID=A0A0F9HAL5_9ZZZZ